MLLGLDLGTSRVKALLLAGDGTVWGQSAVPTPFSDGEMTVEQLEAAVAEAVRGLGGRPLSQIVAVGLAGMAESGAPLTRRGESMAPIIAWHDPRGADVVERLQRDYGPDLERDIGRRLGVVSSVAKLGWLVDHGVGAVSRWLGVPELVLLALTGNQMTDFSLASRTGAYDGKECRYREDVVVALGVPAGVFPGVGAAGDVMGRVLPAAGHRFGLPVGIPVTVAGHDHLVARAGAGARGRDLVNSVGTAETVTALVPCWPDIEVALAQRVAVTVMPDGGGWALVASAARAGIVLAVVAEGLGASLEELDRAASALGAVGAAGAADGLVEAALSGCPLRLDAESPAVVWNNLLAALAARTWDACDRLARVERALADDGRRLVVCGGGSRSRPWLRAKAAARPATPMLRSGATEAVARGAAIYAGVAVRWWPGPDDGPPPVLEAI